MALLQPVRHLPRCLGLLGLQAVAIVAEHPQHVDQQGLQPRLAPAKIGAPKLLQLVGEDLLVIGLLAGMVAVVRRRRRRGITLAR